jgi:hypothetical protein
MLKAKSFATLTVALGLVAVLPAVASAAWSQSGVGAGTTAATSVQAPATATAAPTTGSTSTSITISWTAPSGGPTPTGYRVDRVSPSATVCTVAAATLTCNDAARTPGTSYSYNVYALIQAWDGTSTAASSATSAAADTTAPVVTANCPTNSTSYSNASNNGNGTWNKACTAGVAVTATDAVGVTSAAVKLTKGTACWNGTDSAATGFTVAACTAAGPAGYPAGYVSLTAGTGSSWARTLSGPSLATGSWTLEALARDAAGNTASKLTVAFTVTT